MDRDPRNFPSRKIYLPWKYQSWRLHHRIVSSILEENEFEWKTIFEFRWTKLYKMWKSFDNIKSSRNTRITIVFSKYMQFYLNIDRVTGANKQARISILSSTPFKSCINCASRNDLNLRRFFFSSATRHVINSFFPLFFFFWRWKKPFISISFQAKATITNDLT